MNTSDQPQNLSPQPLRDESPAAALPHEADVPHLPQPISLLINANSRRGKDAFDSAVAALKVAKVPLKRAVAMGDKEETDRLLREEIAGGARLVIIGGGDGTLSHCANLLAGTQTAMAVLPLGTGNTWARSLGLPLNLEQAAQVIAKGHIENSDVGRVNGRIFLNSVALGLSCEIAQSLDKNTKKKLGLLAWPLVGSRVLWKHKPLQIKVTSRERIYRVRTHQILIVNGRYVAGPVTAAPDASIQDSSLDVFTLGGAKFSSLLHSALTWLRGQHLNDPQTKFFSTQHVRIESLRRPISAAVDGETDLQTPLDIDVWPGALQVVVPQGFRAEEA